MNAKARNAAIRECRELADSIIEQRTRLAAGWDQNGKRDDEPNRTSRTRSPYQRIADDSAAAFALSAKFKSETPITDSQLARAVERAQELADLTFAREIPFLGVYGAAGASCFSDGVMSKVCGLEYVRLIQVYTGHAVPCDAYGFLVTESGK